MFLNGWKNVPPDARSPVWRRRGRPLRAGNYWSVQARPFWVMARASQAWAADAGCRWRTCHQMPALRCDGGEV